MKSSVVLIAAVFLAVNASAQPKATATPAQQTKAPAKKAAAPAFKPALLNPTALKAQAPAEFEAKFVTTKGDFVVKVTRDWSPNGADRFYNLVQSGYYDGAAFFRVVSDFVVQFGISAHPRVAAVWREAAIPDEPVKASNKRGFVTFAKGGPNSRTTQIFINLADRNTRLDAMGFPPFGVVTQGMEVVDTLHAGYGESPNQGRIQMEGRAYLEKEFPQLDTIKTATIISPVAAPVAKTPAKKAPPKKS